MPGLQDFRNASDSKILDEMERLLKQPVADVISEVSFYQLELTRRAVERLQESSRRLETLTKVLIGATAVLLIAATPPALEMIARWCSR